MLLLEIIHHIINSSVTTPLPCSASPAGSGTFTGTYCTGSALQAITAAYGTQGIWVMSDMVNQLIWTKLNALAPLMYLIAAGGALVSLALGAPPKMYLWLIFGPGLYHFLLETSVPAKGMDWRIGQQQGDMEKVWRLSEVGLVNSNAGVQGAIQNDGTTRGSNVKFTNNAEPDSFVQVPYFFAWFDNAVSSVIREMTSLTGMFNERPAATTVDTDTSLPQAIPSTAGGGAGTTSSDKWYLLSNAKWGIIQDITDAKIHDPNVRLLLVEFFASECGDAFANNVNKNAYVNALYGQAKSMPCSVLSPASDSNTDCVMDDGYISTSGFGGNDPVESMQYSPLIAELDKVLIPTPDEVGQLFFDGNAANVGTFGDAVNETYDSYMSDPGDATRPNPDRAESMRCTDILNLLIAAFRWESGILYHQIVNSVPDELNNQNLVFELLYGWDIRDSNGAHLSQDVDTSGSGNFTENDSPQANFIKDLILVHLIRNEMMVASPGQLVDGRIQLSADTTQASANGHLRYVASKNKMQEFYQWALMIPHMQGVLLYYLAIAYPFACLMMIIPGMHKSLVTWMSFWAWAKAWDLGFAIVMALERSVWAMLGSGSSISKAFWLISDMQHWGVTSVGDCTSTAITNARTACPFVPIALMSAGSGGYTGTWQNFSLNYSFLTPGDFINQLRIFDRALSVAASLDLDLQNSYYVYIMAGLYFAVPVVAGQMLLGAKSGMTSLVNNVIGGVGQEAGRQAASGYQGDLQYRMKNAEAQTGFGAYEKSMRANGMDGFAGRAIDAGNQKTSLGMSNSSLGQQQKGNDAGTEMLNLQANSTDRAISALSSLAGLPGALSDKPGSTQTISGKTSGGGFSAQSTPIGSGGSGSGSAGSILGGFMTNGKFDPQSFIGSITTPASKKGAMEKAGAVAKTVGAQISNSAWQKALDSDQAAAVDNFRLGNQQFANQASMSAFDLSGDRTQRQGEFKGRMAAWNAQNAYANNMSATSAALGGLNGGLDPGQKPQDMMGMAMSGNLGSAIKAGAMFGNAWKKDDPNKPNDPMSRSNDAYFSSVAQQQGALDGRGNVLQATARGTTFASLAVDGANQLSEVPSRDLIGSNWTTGPNGTQSSSYTSDGSRSYNTMKHDKSIAWAPQN